MIFRDSSDGNTLRTGQFECIIDSGDLHLYIDRPVNVEVVRKILNQTNIDPLESVANASTHADFEEHIKVKKIL